MSRIIINTDGNMSDDRAIFYVMDVIKCGKISDNVNSYCHVTVYTNGFQVLVKRTKSGHSFTVSKA